MLKLIIFLTIIITYSCNHPDASNKDIKNPKVNKLINKNIELKKADFKIIKFDKEVKEVYRKKLLKKIITKKQYKKELSFNKLFEKFKKNIVTVQFYVNFEKFSSLPEIYKDKMNNSNTFFLSGIHIGENYILTELNVLKEANIIYIKDDMGINYLDIVGYDENYNIALLKSSQDIKTPVVDIMKLKDRKYLAGDLIFSIFSVSSKIYSFRKHFINFLHYSEFYEVIDVLFSSSISNIGNSGGIIFNSFGEFLGITSLYDSYYQNSSFIITNEIIKKILPQLKRGYQIKSNGWLGVYLKERNMSVYIKKVVKDSPAIKAGIKNGDKILEINKIKIKSKKNIKRIMNFIGSGNIVNLKLERNKKTFNISIKIINKPLKYLYKNNKNELKDKHKELGIKLVEKENCITVSEVKEGSLAFIYGIKIGDKLLEISNTKIDSIKKYNHLIDNTPKNKNIKLKLLRGKEIKLIAFKKS